MVYVPEKRKCLRYKEIRPRSFLIRFKTIGIEKLFLVMSLRRFTEMRVQFVLGEREATVNVINQEPLSFGSSQPEIKVKEDKLQNLFAILFNLGDYDEASRVSILTKSEKQQFQNEPHIRMNVFGQDLMLIRKTNELVVVNFTQGFKCPFHSF